MSRPLSEHGSDVIRDRTLLHNSSHNNLIRRRALQHKIVKTLTMVKRSNMEEEEDWSVEEEEVRYHYGHFKVQGNISWHLLVCLFMWCTT